MAATAGHPGDVLLDLAVFALISRAGKRCAEPSWVARSRGP